MSQSAVVIVLTTWPAGEEAPDVEACAHALVDEQLAACVNILPPMRSLYRWNGEVQRDSERQVLMKTTRERVEALRARLRDFHPYEVPEFLVLDVAGGSDAYLSWVNESVSPDPPIP